MWARLPPLLKESLLGLTECKAVAQSLTLKPPRCCSKSPRGKAQLRLWATARADEPQLQLFMEWGADSKALLLAPSVDENPIKGSIIQTQRGTADMENIEMMS